MIYRLRVEPFPGLSSTVTITGSDAVIIGGENLEAAARIIAKHGGSASVEISKTMSIAISNLDRG